MDDSDGMKSMTLRQVPDELHATLVARARANRRSLNQEVIAELSGGCSVETEDERKARVEREIERARKLRSRMRGFMTAAEIDTAKRHHGRA